MALEISIIKRAASQSYKVFINVSIPNYKTLFKML